MLIKNNWIITEFKIAVIYIVTNEYFSIQSSTPKEVRMTRNYKNENIDKTLPRFIK